MSEVFNSYEQEFCRYQNNINRVLSQLNTLMNERKEIALQDVQSDLQEADKCLKQMDMEVSSLGADLRKELRLKMRRYKADTDDMRKRFLKAEGDLMDFKNRENLMGGLELQENQNQVEQFIKEGQILSSQNLKLREAVRTGHEIEKQAIDIQFELARHGDIIEKDISKTRGIEQDLSESHTLVKGMAARIQKNKLILCGVLAMFSVVTITILYVRYGPQSQTQTTPPPQIDNH